MIYTNAEVIALTEFGKFMRDIRENNGNVTQEELGNKLGLTRQQWMRYENGKTKDISKDITEKLEEIFNIPSEIFRNKFYNTDEFKESAVGTTSDLEKNTVDLSHLPTKVVEFLKDPKNKAVILEMYISNT